MQDDSDDSDDRGGLVHCYYGPGKGKSTAAMGLALRALGHDWSVAIVQFMKGHEEVGEPYGEIERFRAAEAADVQQFPTRHASGPDDLSEEERAVLRRGFETATDLVSDAAADVVVLDELTMLDALDVADATRIAGSLREKDPAVEVVVTGRRAGPALVDVADYVTYMAEVKHPYDRGIDAIQGIEY